MEWLLEGPQIQSTFGSLGAYIDGDYHINEKCQETLNEIILKLTVEDVYLRTYRRAIGFGHNVKNDAIPLLIHAKDSKIIDTNIRLLVNLTVPVECLLPVESISGTDVGRLTVFELNKLLITNKEAFADSKATQAVINFIKWILETDSKLTIDNCNSINNCLLLLRNILHVPEGNQNQIIWNLFTQSLDKLLLYLMSCPQRGYWAITMAQLIALLFKDQHVSTLQKLLNMWLESSSSESYEDNESNTTPTKQWIEETNSIPTSDSSDYGISTGLSGKLDDDEKADRVRPSATDCEQENCSAEHSDDQEIDRTALNQSREAKANPVCSEILDQIHNNKPSLQMHHAQNSSPCDATPFETDSPLSSKCNPLIDSANQRFKSQKKMSISKESDCGYGTQGISTSSSEEDSVNYKPVHQKPPSNQKHRLNVASKQSSSMLIQEKKEQRRKKLVKRNKSNIANMKQLMHPTNDDISNILKEFTVDFLVKGYSHLIHELHSLLLSDMQIQIDTSHFFWLLTYFLKFAAQLELDLELISAVLSFDIISYLTYEGVMLCEQLEQQSHEDKRGTKPYLRRIHLVVTAIREFMQALDTYKQSTYLTPEEKQKLNTLQNQISKSNNLKCLFILLLRCHNPELHSKQYLQDLIVTNHYLMLLVNDSSGRSEASSGGFMVHMKEFATAEIMHRYGLLLESFQSNGAFVNDCIFTMMHHVGGDLDQIDMLFQADILKTFSLIWENKHEICDDWSDLIEYVIHEFMNNQHLSSEKDSSTPQETSSRHSIGDSSDTWTQEEIDCLHWYYFQCRRSKCFVTDILKLFQEHGNHQKSRISIIAQLRKLDLIAMDQYDELMKAENSNHVPTAKECGALPNTTDDVKEILDQMVKDRKQKMIVWLQRTLLDCCFVKLSLHEDNHSVENSGAVPMEPVPYNCILKKTSIPVVPWNHDQSTFLTYQPFVMLLHKFGLHLPTDAKKIYIRIPEFWTADILYSKAQMLGPLENSMEHPNLEVLKQLHEMYISADICSKVEKVL
ncbi:protein timeless [Malaya genurostris]|uniref:protein timeless n=1 Tax=Malaya genurostris TaxID=325434 RepID=UPI0026F3F1D5|nr:protein timeless [Malaya genurostris]